MQFGYHINIWAIFIQMYLIYVSFRTFYNSQS